MFALRLLNWKWGLWHASARPFLSV